MIDGADPGWSSGLESTPGIRRSAVQILIKSGGLYFKLIFGSLYNLMLYNTNQLY